MNPGDDISKAGGGDYERPGNRHRCGRGAVWRKPCGAGPTPDGQCGGVSECSPILRNGKFECRRPASAGGSCAEGPTTDGKCAHCRPACTPRLTLRARRGRMTWQVGALLVLLLAAGFHFGRGGKSRPLAIDPGPLSAKHAHFTASQGCATCHAAHDASLGGWVKAAFTHSDMNATCATCHAFAGDADRPHNDKFVAHDGPKKTDCRMCHTEHRGADAKLTTLTDAQCNACHQVKMQSFTRGHLAFPASFPRVAHAGVKFDHAKHLLDHFKKPELAARAQRSCVACHTASPMERNVRTVGFDVACARCHAEQIPQNELVLLRLPEPATLAEAAKLGADDATTFMAWFLQRGGGTNYGIALQQFLAAAAKDGVAPLAKVLDERTKTNASAMLLAGLSPELLLRPAQLWTNQQKFEPAAGKVQNGWYWLEDLYPELRYKPAGHADTATRAWIEFAISDAGRGSSDEGDRKRAAAFEKEVTHLSTGVGHCLKCHVVSGIGKGISRVEWGYQPAPVQPHTKFSHGVHISLKHCEDCHVLDPKADYEGQFKIATGIGSPGVSNFKSIELPDCASCHAENKVRNDCSLCHEYHHAPSLKDMAVK